MCTFKSSSSSRAAAGLRPQACCQRSAWLGSASLDSATMMISPELVTIAHRLLCAKGVHGMKARVAGRVVFGHLAWREARPDAERLQHVAAAECDGV